VTPHRPPEDPPPDIEVGAQVKARKLRFRSKPETEAEFHGGTRIRSDERVEDVELETESGSERHNLPDEVEPGVTYRDVEVGWSARARARTSGSPSESKRR
jgi:hypothetical protein